MVERPLPAVYLRMYLGWQAGKSGDTCLTASRRQGRILNQR